MEKESEAQVFLDEAVEHVKEFINGHPTKETAQEKKELASIRAIRERTISRDRNSSLKEQDNNSDKDETEKDYE